MPTATEWLLVEFDQEMATTRNTLAAVPEATFGWRPHAKSMQMDRLCGHIAVLPGWISDILTSDTLEVGPDSSSEHIRFVPKSPMELLERFDSVVTKTRAVLASAPVEKLDEPWAMTFRGNTFLTLPKQGAIRTWALNHLVHHRGQLTVYLRLNDIPVPSIYGPTADRPA